MGWEILSAARNGDRVKIQKCLENGEDLNSKDPEGSTPLHLVAIKGFEDILYFLLEQHADINSLDENDETPLHKASRYGRVKIVEILLQHGANPNALDKFDETPIFKACRYGHTPIVSCLLHHGADINRYDQSGMTILMKASLRGLRNIVSLLIDRGANLDLVAQAKSKLTVSGTALLFAVLSGHLPIVKLLLSAGADVNIRDNGDRSPLYHAINNQNWTCVGLLLHCLRIQVFLSELEEFKMIPKELMKYLKLVSELQHRRIWLYFVSGCGYFHELNDCDMSLSQRVIAISDLYRFITEFL